MAPSDRRDIHPWVASSWVKLSVHVRARADDIKTQEYDTAIEK
jgi:hypothetical protein